jgi:uncharacterized integral membrane protein
MSEDPTRAMPMPGAPAGEVPAYGRVGPSDPHADPATHPGLRPADVDGPATDPGIPPVPAVPPALPAPPQAPTVPTVQPGKPDPVRRSRTGGLWTGLILSAIVLIFLLVFILQNQFPVQINFLWFGGSVPVGVALLLAAIAGLLLVAIPGGVRIMQLRRAARRAARR